MEIEECKTEIVLPNADVFLKNLDDYVEKANDVCLKIISEKLNITKEEAEELANKIQDEAFDEYMKEQLSKDFKLRKGVIYKE